MQTTSCRRCSECRGASHHWIPNGPEFDPAYKCKHCDATGDECGECEGEGCDECGGEGVIARAKPLGAMVKIIGDHPWTGYTGVVLAIEKPSIGILPPMARVRLDDGHECYVEAKNLQPTHAW